MKSFQITGEPAKGLKYFGFLALLSCFAFCISTASMSDGGDMNWTIHVAGASSFFIISLFLMLKASKIYRKLWKAKPGFIGFWSYQIKKYTNFFIIGFIVLQGLEIAKVIQIYALVEWLATFFLLVYILTLYWDFDKMCIWLVKKRGE